MHADCKWLQRALKLFEQLIKQKEKMWPRKSLQIAINAICKQACQELAIRFC